MNENLPTVNQQPRAAKVRHVFGGYMVRDLPAADAPVCDTPARIVPLLKKYARKDREHFVAVYLTARSQVIAVEVVSVGTLSASLVHPREVFKGAILHNAAAVIVAHNHPSGDTTPSAEDKDATRRLSQAGTLLGIPLLDHLVIGARGYSSFKEMGLLS